MKGVRVFGFIFSSIFAFGSGLIGYSLTQAYLEWSILKHIDINLISYGRAAAVAFAAIGVLLGFLVSSIIYRRMVEFGQSLRRIAAEDKIAVIFGTIFSLIPAFFLDYFVLQTKIGTSVVKFAIVLLLTMLIIWLFNVIALSMKEELKFFAPAGAKKADDLSGDSRSATAKLLDTNVIIDGRIYDICRSGFLEGILILPGFVLEELQHIADSADAMRRNRGRRGLDILFQMQKELDITIQVMDRYKATFSPGDAVDIKLVKLAKFLGNTDLVTNDYNLNKVAKLHGVRVLNVNELANALKPIVLPGEDMVITLVREGKEYNQAVGYLDDGTMVVVENGKRLLGETVRVSVSSVLQTVAGKMIFAEVNDNTQEASKRTSR